MLRRLFYSLPFLETHTFYEYVVLLSYGGRQWGITTCYQFWDKRENSGDFDWEWAKGYLYMENDNLEEATLLNVREIDREEFLNNVDAEDLKELAEEE